MTKHASNTHQNLSVWARRLNITLPNIDMAAKIADGMFGMESRRAVLMTLGIKQVSLDTDLPTSNTAVTWCGIAMGQVLYNEVYGESSGKDLLEAFHVALMQIAASENNTVTTVDALKIFLQYHETAVCFIFEGINSRKKDKANPSIVNAVLAKAKR
jgi:hypothetical protein